MLCAMLWVLLAAPNIPALQGHVNDAAHILSQKAVNQLEQVLQAHEAATGQQFALLTVDTLHDTPIENFSIEVVDAWKLGRAKQDNGLLLLIAMQEHGVRIEVGYGLEDKITDFLANRIINNIIQPAFKQGDYTAGIMHAMQALMQLGRGEAVVGAQRVAKQDDSVLPFAIIAALLFLFFFFRGGGGGIFPGGYMGGGFGGGGGFRGGGGNFGGGGASGKW